MNGLRMVRIRCNFSEMELATLLGVTRQSISMWENGKKKIPGERLNQLSVFFGLDKKYFCEITETEKEELLNLPMFGCIIDGKEKYKYKISQDTWVDRAYYLDDLEETFDAMNEKANKRKQEVLSKIESIIDGPKTIKVYEKSSYIHKQCNLMEHIIRLKDIVDNQKSILKVPVKKEMIAVTYSMLLAYGVISEDEYDEFFSVPCSMLGWDKDFYNQMTESMKKHWAEILNQFEDHNNKTKKEMCEYKHHSNEEFLEYLEKTTFDKATLKGCGPSMKFIFNKF